MLWRTIKRESAFKALSVYVAAVFAFSIVAPGAAALAQESTSTPTPEETIEVPAPAEPEPAPEPVEEPAAEEGVEEPGEIAQEPTEAPVGSEDAGEAAVEEPAEKVPDVASTPLVAEASEEGSADTVKPAREGRTSLAVEVAPALAAALTVPAVRPDERGPRDDFPPPWKEASKGCGLATVTTLWAGQHIDAGVVRVWNDETNLYVEYDLAAGHTMLESQVYVGLVPPAGYNPGGFPYKTDHDPAVSYYKYTIPLSDLGDPSPGTTVYIAAHAAMGPGESSGETGWAGQGQWPGLLFTHTIEECEEPESVVKTWVLEYAGPADGARVLYEIGEGGEEPTSAIQPLGPGDEEGTWTGETELELPANGLLILSAEWQVLIDGVWVTLGVVEYEPAERLVEDRTNEFEYDNAIYGQKLHDVDESGDYTQGDQPIEGWDIFLYRIVDDEPVLFDQTVTDENGAFSFEDLPPGDYELGEGEREGWYQTFGPPGISVENGTNEDGLDFGNALVDVEKTFELTYEGAPEGIELWVLFWVDGEIAPFNVPLDGDGPAYSGSRDLKYGTTITEVRWMYAFDDEVGVLGTTEGETLTEDVTNEFEYDASLSGHKFEDLDGDGIWDEGEEGVEGWAIFLYRMAEADELQPSVVPTVAPGFELYDSTVTGPGGYYEFTGLLPGLYMVAEDEVTGWVMTVAPDGSIEIGDGSAVEDRDFGNRRLDSDIEILKGSDAPPEGVEAGTLVTYEFVVTNTGELTLFDVVVDDDHLGLVGVIEELAPGESETLTASAVLEETTTNVVEASGMDIFEREVSDDDTHTVEVFAPFTPAPEADPGGEPAAGEDPAQPAQQQPAGQEPFLPFTGSNALFLLVAAAVAAAAGLLLRRAVSAG
jgi:hypothetical protein